MCAPCPFQVKVATREPPARRVNQGRKPFGGFDFLVNNAGITRDNLILRMKEDDWDEVINTNLKGAWNFAKARCARCCDRTPAVRF